MLNLVTLLWEPNHKSYAFSRVYDETWVTKLYWGFKRNIVKHNTRFILYTDRQRNLPPFIEQVPLQSKKPGYGDCIQPYELNEPMILVGLDTIITGNIDHLADYCMKAPRVALPRAVYRDDTVCNGVALVPGGLGYIWDEWRGQNDMEWMRQQDHAVIDELFPGHVVSYKGHVKKRGLGNARIVFFHGNEKPHELKELPWIRENWR